MLVTRLRFAALALALLAGAAGAAPQGRDDLREPLPALDLADPRHVRALYLDTLGRTPDDDELALAASVRPSKLVSLLLSHPGFWRHWHEDELQELLLVDSLRPADSPPGRGLPERLAGGELGVLEALAGLASSSAFHRANPGNDTFVSVVLEQFLGLVVQEQPALLEAGKRMYDGRPATLFGVAGDSQADVVAIVAARPGFAARFIARQHRRVVGREAAATDVERWSQRLRSEPLAFPALVGEWLLSPAYAERLGSLRRKTDRQFLLGLGVDLLGREPDEATLAQARAALAAVADAGPLRTVLARVLLERHGERLPLRDDPGEQARALFLRFLGRPPATEELLAFTHGDEAGTPAAGLAALALITHPEYQYY